MFKFLISVLCIVGLSGNAFGEELALNKLGTQKASYQKSRTVASTKMSQGIFSTTNLAWGTMALLGATALTGREQKVNPIHLSLASLSMISYGAFLTSYFSNDDISSENGYKYASYSKWIHIPAMILLPIAGAVAQRHFAQGKTSASGIGSVHKPAALAAVVGMALTTFSLTFQF